MAVYNFKGADKAKVLAALFNAAHSTSVPISKKIEETMTVGDAKNILLSMHMRGESYIRTIRGRLLDVHLGDDQIDLTRYEIANGAGTGKEVMANIFVDAGEEVMANVLGEDNGD